MIQLITLNVQGFRSLQNRQTFMSWVNCFGPDIICLQETHSTSEREFTGWFSPNNVNINNTKYKYKCISSPGTIRSSGVAILLKSNFQVVKQWRDDSGRLIVAELARDNFNFQVGCLYGPNNKDDGAQFFESLYQAIDPAIPVLLSGDYNTVVDPYLDRFGCNPNSPWAYNWSSTLRDLMGTFDLCDVWRAHHPTSKEFTWRRPNGKQGSRIDMVWMPQRYLGLVTSVGIFPFFRSDHSYVHLNINLPFGVKRGKGLWKFNTAHLQDEAFCNKIERFWLQWRAEKDRFLSLSSWWDAGKARLKRLIQSLSRDIAREKNQIISELNKRMKVVQKRLNDGEQLPGLLEEIKAELESKLTSKAKGAQLRARIQWAEEGESSTAYFLRQEQVRGQQSLISGIRRSDGSIATTTNDMLGVWRDYYLQLFSSTSLEEEEQELFLNSLERRLSEAESELCEGDLTEGECERALHRMPSNKSPGVDGLPADFYVRFWKLLGPDLTNVFNSCFHQGRLPVSQRSGAITLLYKKGDILNTANWRPITLLCADYKIVAKALSIRLLRVIAVVVSPDQSCGIPGRFMGENVRLLHDVVDYSSSEGVSGAILSLDQEKAFDRVEWSYLTKVLVRMGFGESFRSWVRLLYTEVFSAVTVNGFVTEQFPVSRGVRQGCPLSPLLYVLVAESLACAIRADPKIDGFPLPGGNKHVKVSQYADDTSTFATTDESVQALFELFAKYELASGAKLNQSKCHGLLLGSWRTRTSFPVDLRWSSSHIEALGSRLSHDGEQTWGPALQKLDKTLSSWQHRKLSFRGRALIINSLGLSRFWYLGSVVPIDSDLVKKLNKITFPFLWARPREWLSRASVTQPLRQGGLGVVDVSRKLSSLRVMWVKRFFCGDEHPWFSFFQHHLRRALKADNIDRAFESPAIRPAVVRRLPPFYRMVLQAWLQLGGRWSANKWVIPRPSSTDIQLTALTARTAYVILGSSLETPHRCHKKFAHLNIDWKHVWPSLDTLRYLRPAADTCWLCAHGILPTADRLLRFGMPNISPSCHCGEEETAEHLFESCPHARTLLVWFFQRLVSFDPHACFPRSRESLWGYPKAAQIPKGLIALLGIIRHSIWVARNAFRFDGIQPQPHVSLKRIKSSFRFLLRIQRRHCLISTFEKEWLVGGLFGSLLADGSISFIAELHSTPGHSVD